MFATHVPKTNISFYGEIHRMNTSLSEQRIQNNRIRRRRELKRRRRAGALILLMTALFLSTFFSLRIRAQGNENKALSKYYTSIQVQTGDTLWSYACQYGDRRYYESNGEYIEEVMEINSLRDENIAAGQYLILPYYRPLSAAGNVAVSPVSPGAGQL